jgi:hypothetical protein
MQFLMELGCIALFPAGLIVGAVFVYLFLE